jgi:uncharacterized protein YraI
MDHQISTMNALKRVFFLGLLAAAASAPLAAQAQQAFTAQTAHLRAGPAQDYPVVAILGQGFPVDVQGCVPSYTWCDVIAGPNRGWLWAGNISYAYQNSYVPLLNYGPAIGIGILAFGVDDYWGHYYRDRPWFRQRDRWIHHPPPPQRFIPPGQRIAPGQRVPPPEYRPPYGTVPGGQHPQRQPDGQRSVRPAQPAQPQGGGSGWNPGDPRGNERTRQQQNP